MRQLRKKFINTGAAAILAFGLLLATAHRLPAQTAPVATPDVVLIIDPSQSQVHWNVDSTLHLVHGTFTLKSGTVHFNTENGKADGEIVVSAPSGESGNDSRDRRMHKEILETAKYPNAIFRPTHIEGKVNRSGTSDVKLSGIFSIHGADHELTSQVHAELTGGHWTGTSKFEIPYVQWGIKDPSNFLLKVKPVVKIELEMSGAVTSQK
jgi:polyisoprenoid-binding protein YceI